jgi:hypothetical protein
MSLIAFNFCWITIIHIIIRPKLGQFYSIYTFLINVIEKGNYILQVSLITNYATFICKIKLIFIQHA